MTRAPSPRLSRSVPAGPVPIDSPQKPSGARLWWLAARPKTLPAAATPVIVGTACALGEAPLSVPRAGATLVGALLLQIAANFANDVFDYEKGADTVERVGPTRAVQAGWVTPGAMRRALVVTLLLALAVGAYLVSVAGPVLVAIGLASMIAAVAYTAGPYPLGYHGLGDVFVLIFFGFVAVAGTAFVQLGRVPELAWICAIPVGCLATCILVVNNVRDVATDAVAGKRTLPVRFGRRFGVNEYRLLISLSYAVPIYLLVSGRLGAWALLSLLSLPWALRISRQVELERGPALNASLAATAKLMFVHGLLLSVSLAIGRGG